MLKESGITHWAGGVINWTCPLPLGAQVIYVLVIEPGVTFESPWGANLELRYASGPLMGVAIARWEGNAREWRCGDEMEMTFIAGLPLCEWPGTVFLLWPEEFCN